ncbi:MAG: glycosyl hydrolase repeat-containing protein [Gemmatimonadetes bacterium]|nr:glycosyl hydrolase repeat-containing protein [Gemmatimonadota bacterium]
MPPIRRTLLALLLVAGAPASVHARAQALDPAQALRWRMIGPHRGGRTVAAVGVPSRPGVFYIGANNGGVWKSTDYGRIWAPVFDDQPTGSIGAIAVAPSNPDVVYVGSGEGLQRPDLSTGDGVYRSADGGRTWTHLGLRDGQQIPALAVDPRDPDRVFAAVLGHPYGPNAERGVFRSTDGGRTWKRVLYRDENTGAFDVVLDPRDPNTVYAVTWAGRQAPWEIGGSFLSAGSGLWKSTDGGDTWRPLTRGLPDWEHGRLGRIGMVIAPSDPRRLYALVDATAGGVFRSDDAGESWTRIQTDERLWSRGSDFAELRVDPKDADVVYDANVVTWKSTDGGHTWGALRGAPGGDDYHRLWIDPADPRIILLASDQGAVVTVNGGQTWGSWYNQPTAQFYHVNTDNAFPYRVCGGQQESGSACVSSRGDYGEITLRDWIPVGAEEYGYAVPDPLDPDLVYGGKITRFDRRTKQVQDVSPRAFRSPGYRLVRTAPIAFSPADPHLLFFASNTVWRTRDGGQHWDSISPDLTRARAGVPPVLGVFAADDPEKGAHRGVVYALAPSPLDAARLWAGTDDGSIHVTSDGGASWRDVTPPAAAPWSKVSVLEASHFDTATAYAAINTFRLDDLRPHVLRTRDGGRTWREVTAGLPDGAIVNVVREDPVRRGLLYAGTETAVFWSTDDGEHWRPLRRNMPATSIRDLAVHGADLVAATHGRSFWILDDVSPLRQAAEIASTAPAGLARPAEAVRVRWNLNTDTPIPPDEPSGENPPDGAVLDYWLAAPAHGPVTLEVLDAGGRVVRRFASTDSAPPVRDEGNVPAYWIRPPQVPSAAAGMHRFVWDLHGAPPAAPESSFPIAAVAGNTARVPQGPWALPGAYTVRLTVDGRTYTQPLAVRMDPRVTASPAVLAQQLALGTSLAASMDRAARALADVDAYRAQIKTARGSSPTAPSPALEAADSAAAGLQSGGGGIARIAGQLAELYGSVQGVDAEPTSQTHAAIDDRLRALDAALARWDQVRRSTPAPGAAPRP